VSHSGFSCTSMNTFWISVAVMGECVTGRTLSSSMAPYPVLVILISVKIKIKPWYFARDNRCFLTEGIIFVAQHSFLFLNKYYWINEKKKVIINPKHILRKGKSFALIMLICWKSYSFWNLSTYKANIKKISFITILCCSEYYGMKMEIYFLVPLNWQLLAFICTLSGYIYIYI
jgi:hypothetical protein